MNELTYILGAGASFQSIPIVKTFPRRFLAFVKHFTDLSTHPKFDESDVRTIKKISEEFLELHQAFESHQSFDTYFKKLFHTNQPDQIKTAKKYLNLYFTWEHLSKVDIAPDKFEDGWFRKRAKTDKRYDALIAGLLRPTSGNPKVYCKTNFVTWNYDMNLLISIKNYFYPNNTFRWFIENIVQNNTTWVIDEQITVINMNGYFYSSDFDKYLDLTDLKFEDVVKRKLGFNYFDKDFIDADAELIKFAWETNDFNGEIAKSKINESKNIVVIGYTFPLYNRLVDLHYFNKASVMSKSTYIQDPLAGDFVDRVLKDFNLYYTPTRILNCDSFFVPSDIFELENR